MIDPALYSLNKSEIIWASSERTIPTAFKLYTGSFLPSMSLPVSVKNILLFTLTKSMHEEICTHTCIYAKSMAILCLSI